MLICSLLKQFRRNTETVSVPQKHANHFQIKKLVSLPLLKTELNDLKTFEDD